jgi:hypothetical protein
MRCPYLEDCSKQKWTANVKSFKNPIRHTVRCRTCGFSRGSLKWVLFGTIFKEFLQKHKKAVNVIMALFLAYAAIEIWM